MSRPNIINSSTGQTGYQVPGAAMPNGYSSLGGSAPQAPIQPSPIAAGFQYQVQPGEDMNALTKKFGVGGNEITLAGSNNGEFDPGSIKAGMNLNIGITPNDPRYAQVQQAIGTPTPVNTAQPSPQKTAINPANGTLPQNPLAPPALPGSSPYANTANNPGAAPGTPGTPDATQAIANKYQSMNAAGAPPGTNTDNRPSAAIQQQSQAYGNNTQTTPTSTPQVDNFFQTNPAVNQIAQNTMDFLSPPNVRNDLISQMSKLQGDQSTMTSEKMDLMNIKRVMSGTEQDLRDEVTKANGFASESQIQALTISRNKTLLKQASFLQDQLSTQQDVVANDQNLMNFEKDMANTQFSQRMQILNYQQQNTQNVTSAARSMYTTMIDKNPEGLYKSLLTDPVQAQRFEAITGMTANDLAGMRSGNYEVVKGGMDAFGNPLADKVFDKKTGQFVSGGSYSPGGTPDLGGGNNNTGGAVPIIGSGNIGVGSNHLSFDQYGLLANTNFNPKNMVDGLAQKYIDQYIKNGTVPTASSLGRNMKPEAMAQVDARARELYFNATGTPLPNPEIIKGNQKIINSNNQFVNNLTTQEATVKANFGLNLENLKANDLNSSNVNAVNNFIDNVKQYWLGNPEAAQYALQNSTVQNEVGSLLAIRNSSGTTVHDKLVSSGLIPKGASLDQQKQVLQTLLAEAGNAKSSFANATSDLYKQVDPLMQDPNNPMRDHMRVESALNKVGANYSDVVSKTPAGSIPVMDKDGNIGYIKPTEFNSNYTKL